LEPAGRVNLSGWAKGDERYIGFLKGKGEVSDYFKEFLGCDTTIQSRVETSSLVAALKSFADKQKFDSIQRDAFMERALSICDRDARAGKPVEFSTLANELHPDEPEMLSELLSDPELRLNDGFVADRRALKGLISFKKKTANWSVEFDRRALHTGKVRYSREDNTITLLDVPDDLRQELSEELRDD
jgi:nucleoid-associated protein